MVQERGLASALAGDVPPYLLGMTSPPPLRRRLRANRRALGRAERHNNARSLARLLGRHRAFLHAHRVGAYWAADGEMDPFPLLRLAHARHKDCFLPVLRPHPRRKLWFLAYRPGDPLEKNRFAIPEPRLRNRRIRLPWALDLLLVPLVGFDSDCNRLGMGGGFYDRSLAYLRYRRSWRRPLLVGLAHECQRIEALQPNPWDVPLDMVATEKGIYARSRTGFQPPQAVFSDRTARSSTASGE